MTTLSVAHSPSENVISYHPVKRRPRSSSYFLFALPASYLMPSYCKASTRKWCCRPDCEEM